MAASGKLTLHSKFDFRVINLTRIMQFHFALGEGIGWSADKTGEFQTRTNVRNQYTCCRIHCNLSNHSASDRPIGNRIVYSAYLVKQSGVGLHGDVRYG